MSATNLLSAEQLAKAAFHLLASSTADRYLRMAKEIVSESGLGRHLRRNPSLIHDAIVKARHLWQELIAQNQRDVPEVELAILLTALSDIGAADARPLLKEIAGSTAPSAICVKTLSISLLKNRSHRQLVDCHVNRHASGSHRRLLEQACT